MRLSIKGSAVAAGLLWGGAILIVGLINLASVVIGSIDGLIDGAIAGCLFGMAVQHRAKSQQQSPNSPGAAHLENLAASALSVVKRRPQLDSSVVSLKLVACLGERKKLWVKDLAIGSYSINLRDGTLGLGN